MTASVDMPPLAFQRWAIASAVGGSRRSTSSSLLEAGSSAALSSSLTSRMAVIPRASRADQPGPT